MSTRSRFLAAALAAFTSFGLAQEAAPADPDLLFKGQMGGTFGKNVVEVMPAGKRIAVAAFRVGFVVDNSVTAQVRAAYLPGRDMSGARSSLFVALKGVDNATLQAIADKTYGDLLAQLAASGREVVPLEQMRELHAGMKAAQTSAEQPYTRTHNGQTVAFFAPSGMPLVFNHFETGWTDGGMLDFTNYRKLQEISARLDATVIAPVVFVNFAKMSSSGNQSGLLARSAETGVELSMAVVSLHSAYVRTEEFRNGMLMKGDEGSFQMTGAVGSPLAFGRLQETARDNNAAVKGILDVIGKAAGIPNAGGIVRSSTKALAETTNEAYSAAASDALQRWSAAMGRWFAKYPPAQ